MIQCRDCEYYQRAPDGSPRLLCDPYSTIKEPECLAKWQLVQLRTMVAAHEATLELYRRLAPIQERMFRQIEREMDDADDADGWKRGTDEDDLR